MTPQRTPELDPMGIVEIVDHAELCRRMPWGRPDAPDWAPLVERENGGPHDVSEHARVRQGDAARTKADALTFRRTDIAARCAARREAIRDLTDPEARREATDLAHTVLDAFEGAHARRILAALDGQIATMRLEARRAFVVDRSLETTKLRCPRVGGRRPRTRWMKAVLPGPVSPTRATQAPAGISRVSGPLTVPRASAGARCRRAMGGAVLGLVEEAPYETGRVLLDRGDTVVFYSDGVTERSNPEGEWYGVERLKDAARRSRRAPARISLYSILGEIPFPSSAAYNMAKAAINHLARTLAAELTTHRINVNVINPGYIDTPGERAFATEEQIVQAAQNLPWGRLGTPHDIGRAVAFLASADADYITGSALVVDGGYKLAMRLPQA